MNLALGFKPQIWGNRDRLTLFV